MSGNSIFLWIQFAEHFTGWDMILIVVIVAAMVVVPAALMVSWAVWIIVRRKVAPFEPPLFTVFLILACLHYVWIFRTFSWHFWRPLHGNCVRRN